MNEKIRIKEKIGSVKLILLGIFAKILGVIIFLTGFEYPENKILFMIAGILFFSIGFLLIFQSIILEKKLK